MNELENVVFYTMDRAMKSYRQLAQREFKKEGIQITVDQWIILKTLQHSPHSTQKELADTVFKDNASVTRMINLLVNNKFLLRKIHNSDRRRFHLELTEYAKDALEKMQPLIEANREKALKDIKKEDIEIVKQMMNRITLNTSE